MYRWHQERDLMMSRWRFEIALHEYPDWPHNGLAPIPLRCVTIPTDYMGSGFSRFITQTSRRRQRKREAGTTGWSIQTPGHYLCSLRTLEIWSS